MIRRLEQLLATWLVLLLALSPVFGLAPPAQAHHFGGDSTGASPEEDASDDPDGPEDENPDGDEDDDPNCDGDECDEPDPDDCEGDPVSPFSGKWFYRHVDLVVPGVYPIRMVRRHDSLTTYQSPLGYGWAFSHDWKLFEYPDGSVVVRNSCGNLHRYVQTGGAFVLDTPSSGWPLTLETDGAGGFILTRPRGRKRFFDVEGRLTALEDAQGNRLELTYDSRGKLPLTGTSLFAVDPSTPMTVAYQHRVTLIEERTADGTLTGRFVTFQYDDATGRLQWIESHDGRRVTYQHDTVDVGGQLLTTGNLEQVVGPEGITQTFQYTDPAHPHKVTSFQDGAGVQATVNQYDAEGRVLQQTFGGRVLTFNYDPTSADFDFADDASDCGSLECRIVQRTVVDHQGVNPQIATTAYKYTAAGRTQEIIDALGHRRLQIYEASRPYLDRVEIWENQGTPSSPSRVLLKTTELDYDAEGYRTRRAVTLDSGETVTETWTYDHGWVASYEVVSDAAPLKRFRTEYTFYRAGPSSTDPPTNIKEIKRLRDDGSFAVTLHTYDANGQLETVTPPEVDPADGLRIVRSYYGPTDPQPGLLKEIALEVNGAPDPHLKRSFTYDAQGRVATATDARGHVTSFQWDGLGRLLQITNARGESTLLSYSAPNENLADPATAPPGRFLTRTELGQTVADGEGQVRRLRYDDLGNLVRIERKDDADVFSTFQTFAYDSDGSRLLATDAESRTTAFAYDRLQRLVAVTDAGSNTTTFAYDALGNRTTVIDGLGRETRFAYDDLGRLIETEQLGSPAEPLIPSLVTAFGYDAAGNVTAVTDPKDQTTAYAYDALSRLTAVTQPLGQTVSYAYDPRGRLDTLTNARGNVLDYVYEPWGGLQKVDHFPDAAAATPVRTVSYTYDLSGNLETTADTDLLSGAPLYTYTYDALDRVDTATAHYIPGGDRILDSDYDRFGNRSALTLTDGAEVLPHTWTFNDLGRLTQATFPGSQTVTFEYFANDDLQRITHGNGVTTDYTYHPEGPVETITVRDSLGAQLQRLTYTIDAALNVDTLVEDHAAAEGYLYDYAYDGAGRLERADYPTALGLPASETFTYDAVGNRENPLDPSAYEYDANNRMTASPGSITWTYDADGNPANRSDGTSFGYDFTDRLRTYAQGSTQATYEYDALGRRLRKTVDDGTSAATTWFLWDGDDLLAEYDSAGSRQDYYAYAKKLPLVYTDASTSVFQVHSDHLGAPRLASEGASEIAWKVAYAAFGEAYVNGDPDGDGIEIAFALRYPGQRADSENGFYYNYFRYYDSANGRYLSFDPIGQYGLLKVAGVSLVKLEVTRGNGTPNSYLYAHNDPIRRIDPRGLGPVAVGVCVAIQAANAAATVADFVRLSRQLERLNKDMEAADEMCFPSEQAEQEFKEPIRKEFIRTMAERTQSVAVGAAVALAAGLACGGIVAVLP